MFKSAYIACITALLFFFPAQASVVINGTRVVYLSDARELTVQLTNNGKQPVLVQSWLDLGDASATPDAITTPFILTPPINRLDAGKGQSLRITATGTSALPQDRESLFWLNVLEIPGRPGSEMKGENYLQLAIRSRIKFFWRPAVLKDGAVQAPLALTWSDTPQGLKADNPTPYYVSLTSIAFAGKMVDLDMISPLSSQTFSEVKAARGSIIQVAWIDDYGAIRSQSFTVK
ncbi:fimbria/pilus periplasmic chaperone [Entomohabitans teleogrylli]|uniref:fimbria/pilus periplasmic chaperone n=1 Tax=Entomohabitans teleogrylli TaxID=1384589 RepID=UPI00073D3F5F|nr:fimbria/pilus periplasmic chaperone [Entomohabitans teleogrylli]